MEACCGLREYLQQACVPQRHRLERGQQWRALSDQFLGVVAHNALAQAAPSTRLHPPVPQSCLPLMSARAPATGAEQTGRGTMNRQRRGKQVRPPTGPGMPTNRQVHH